MEIQASHKCRCHLQVRCPWSWPQPLLLPMTLHSAPFLMVWYHILNLLELISFSSLERANIKSPRRWKFKDLMFLLAMTIKELEYFLEHVNNSHGQASWIFFFCPQYYFLFSLILCDQLFTYSKTIAVTIVERLLVISNQLVLRNSRIKVKWFMVSIENWNQKTKQNKSCIKESKSLVHVSSLPGVDRELAFLLAMTIKKWEYVLEHFDSSHAHFIPMTIQSTLPIYMRIFIFSS